METIQKSFWDKRHSPTNLIIVLLYDTNSEAQASQLSIRIVRLDRKTQNNHQLEYPKQFKYATNPRRC